MIELSGQIMSRDITVATVKNGAITESNAVLLPLYLKRTGDVEGWLVSRAIDSHRTNSRLLKKALRLTSADDAAIVLKVNAVTITDTYWFREENSSLTYEDVRFKRNMFDRLALSGDPDSFNQPWSPTPELTNIGSFEKCWRLENGKWRMIKQGNELELFSELFICKLGQMLDFPMADYAIEDGNICSEDFTNGAAVNYEAAAGIVGDDEDYILNFDTFCSISPTLAEQYLQIIYLDTICFNMDRHTQNYGVLRGVSTGEIISMSPNFDNNIALFARGITKNLDRQNDKLIELFCELLERDSRALEMVRDFPNPSREMIEQCAAQTGIEIDSGTVCGFVLNGAEQMQERIRELDLRMDVGMQLEP